MHNNKEPVYSNFELLRSLTDPAYNPNPMTMRDLEIHEQVKKFRKLLDIRMGYKWEWNAGAKYLYSELIRAYGLDQEWGDDLLEFAKPKAGRKHSIDKAIRIKLMKQQGMTAKQVAEQLEREGDSISKEGVESYSKRRRKRSIGELVRASIKK